MRLVHLNKREWTQVDIEVQWTYRNIYLSAKGMEKNIVTIE